MQNFFRRQNKLEVKAVFDRHCPPGKTDIDQELLGVSLKDMGLVRSREKLSEDVNWGNMDGSGRINLDDFHRLVQKPSALEELVSGLPLAGLLCSCLSFKMTGRDVLEEVSDLTDADISPVITVFSDGVKQLLRELVHDIKDAIHKMNSRQSACSKFNGKLMNVGKLEEFFKGLGDRVGNMLYCRLTEL
mmetsp:Transcript_40002/g.107044  ORF Transcript_40002/g.107044 Transcript_40002/m.107044 type:complete len:189 (+) Transcript_40002:270-836(+)